MLTIKDIVHAFAAEVDAWRKRTAEIPYERKGILNSEMFFLFLCVRSLRPARILESGRARGQSTLMLATSFPDLPIVSIEHDRNSPDTAVAEARLRDHRNVDLRYGDAVRLLPAMTRHGDVVLIDGPKGFRALRLAIRLLAQGRAELIFLHDVGRSTPERAFLDRYLPGTLYSDDAQFAELAHALDASAVNDLPEKNRWIAGDAPDGYGFTLACLQYRPGRPYLRLLIVAALAGFGERMRTHFRRSAD